MAAKIRDLWIVVVVLVALHAFATEPVAQASPAATTRPVALAFDAGTKLIFKLDGGTLYRRALDAGHWESVILPGGGEHRVTAIAISPQPPHVMYVAVRGSGVMRSTDAGRTWQSVKAGLPQRSVEALAAHATQASTIYAYVRGKGVYRSDDRGEHWRLMGAGPRNGLVQLVHSNMAGSMQTGWLFAATVRGAARSMDCFCGWHDAGALAGPLTAIAYDPLQPARIYAAGTSGLIVSDDGGERWTPMASPGHVTALAATPDRLLAADDKARVSVSRDHGATWERLDG